VALVAVAYLLLNLLFAGLYLAGGDGIEGARADSFADAFFFSVETLSTVGYGVRSPKTAWANALVTLEVLLGLLGFALVAGLVFAKFSLPSSRIAFSRVACLTTFDGSPALLLRMANHRRNYVVEAQLRLTFLEDSRTLEGHSMRRMRDLSLVRSSSPFFNLSWTAVHLIDQESPLYGRDLESLRGTEAQLLASFVGLDASLSQTIHARMLYSVDDLRWGARFVDIMGTDGRGRRTVDNRRLHETTPAPPPSYASES